MNISISIVHLNNINWSLHESCSSNDSIQRISHGFLRRRYRFITNADLLERPHTPRVAQNMGQNKCANSSIENKFLPMLTEKNV